MDEIDKKELTKARARQRSTSGFTGENRQTIEDLAYSAGSQEGRSEDSDELIQSFTGAAWGTSPREPGPSTLVEPSAGEKLASTVLNPLNDVLNAALKVETLEGSLLVPGGEDRVVVDSPTSDRTTDPDPDPESPRGGGALSAIKGRMSRMSAHWSNTWSSISALDSNVKERMTMKQLRKAGVIVEKMQQNRYTDRAINDVCKALFLDQSREDMLKAWEVFNLSGNEGIDAEEFRKILPLLGEDVPEEKIEELFSLADSAGNGTISFDEFVALMKGMNPRGERSFESRDGSSSPFAPFSSFPSPFSNTTVAVVKRARRAAPAREVSYEIDSAPVTKEKPVRQLKEIPAMDENPLYGQLLSARSMQAPDSHRGGLSEAGDLTASFFTQMEGGNRYRYPQPHRTVTRTVTPTPTAGRFRSPRVLWVGPQRRDGTIPSCLISSTCRPRSPS